MKRFIQKLAPVFFFLFYSLHGTGLAIDAYIPHITGGSPNWQDYLQADNSATTALTFQVTLYAAGSQVYQGSFTVNALSERVINLKELAATAETGVINYTNTQLNFRLGYENLTGGGIAEFQLTGDKSQIPAFYFSDISGEISWKGIAITNMNSVSATATLYAVGNGSILGSTAITIEPYQKAVGIHTKWFPSVALNTVKKIIAVSTSELLGISISGNSDSSRMLFMKATPLSEFTAGSQAAVSITSPTKESSYVTSQNQLVISGSASGDNGIASVTWSNDRGGSGVCTGTTSWSATIPLFSGQNIITITTTDAFGNKAQATLMVSHGSGFYSLSGTISAASNAVLDSDVNDPNESYLPNDTPGTAQVIPNPITLGGYVNKKFTGQSGRSYAIGDDNDFFLISLKAGDKIFLSIADYTNADLDLWLYDPAKAEYIDSSTGTDDSEILTIQNDGVYAVNVYAHSGASNYVLAIGAQNIYIAGSSLGLSSDFVPGQAIVRFTDETIHSQAGSAATDSRDNLLSSLGMTMASGGAGRAALLTFDQEDQRASVFQALAIEDKQLLEKQVSQDKQKKMDTLRVIKALRKRADVVYAEPNYIVRHYATPNDTHYGLQWHYPLINLPEAWDTTTGSSDVVVAVVDTGVLINHPDLKSALTSDGYDFISSTSFSLDGDGIDSDPSDPGDGTVAGSSSFHGTHCAGTVAASSNNGKGVSGVGWSTRVMPVRALGKGGQGTGYDIIQGVLYAAGLPNDSGKVPANPADIISLSLGSTYYSNAAQEAYTQIRNAGIIIIAAAGNDASSTPNYPASYNGVVSVSAVDINTQLASYSNYGNYIDIAAPGGDSGDHNGDGYSDLVLSTCGDDSSGTIEYNYSFKAGTSMATPHVAGVVGLMKAVRPGLTPDELDTFLQGFKITDDIGVSGRDDKYGYGLINAYKAVQAALSQTITNTLSVNPVVLNFGYLSTTGTLTVSNLGSGNLTVTGYSDNASWLTVTATDVDADGLGTYTVQISRSGLSEGTYDADITFVSTENSVTVPVNMSVSVSGHQADTGYQYVLLLTHDTLENVQQKNVKAVNGSYSYTFTGVEYGGQYKIYSGSDRDNDIYINDAGEAIGAYSSLDQPKTITVTGDLSNLDFVTDFNFSIPSSLGADPSFPQPQLMRIPSKKSVK